MTDRLPDLTALLPSWLLALQAERKSPGTVEGYKMGVTLFLRWCSTTDTPPVLSKPNVQGFTTYLLDNGAQPATAVNRQLSVKRFAAWLADEGELDANPLLGLKPPKTDVKVTPALTDEQLRDLIKSCAGKSLVCRRDEAIVRLMAETGMRAGETMALQVEDVDVHRGLAVIQRGKGGKGRVVPFSPQTGLAIDRYLRLRRAQRPHDADSGPLWIGGAGKTFSYHGARQDTQETL